MFNFILAIPVAILQFLAAIVYISVVTAFYPFVVIGKLFTTSYYQDEKSYNTQNMTKKYLSGHITDELKLRSKGWAAKLVKSDEDSEYYRYYNGREYEEKKYNKRDMTEDDLSDPISEELKRLGKKGWVAKLVKFDEYFDYYSYYNKSEYKEYGGLDRELAEVPLIKIAVRAVQFIGYTVSFPFVLSYCLLFESAPKRVAKFDGYRKSFRNCVYRHAWDCRNGMYETIYFIKKEDKNTEGKKNFLCVKKDNQCVKSQGLSASSSLENLKGQSVPSSNQQNATNTKRLNLSE